jgi:hypothetical protein
VFGAGSEVLHERRRQPQQGSEREEETDRTSDSLARPHLFLLNTSTCSFSCSAYLFRRDLSTGEGAVIWVDLPCRTEEKLMARSARRLTRVLPPVVAVLALVGGCSDGGDKGHPDDSNTPTPTASSSPGRSPGPSTSEPVSKSPSPTGSAPENPVRAESEVRETWQKFFDPATPVEEKVGLVEDGEQNELMIRPLFTDERFEELRATTTSVTFSSSLEAEVGYRLTMDGQPLEDGSTGGAVFQGKRWKLALQTVCTLTKHSKDVPRSASCDEQR